MTDDAVSTHQHAVRAVWNKKTEVKAKDRFWFFPEVTSHYNRRICGQGLPGSAAGLNHRLKGLGPFGHCVSIGCGLATKELTLLVHDIVEHIDLYDLSDARLAKARENYAEKGVMARANMQCLDPLSLDVSERYDLVYWNSSLHHMNDVYAALAWSRRALKPGGTLAMFEFVGPTRFQWSDRNLDYVRRFRQNLPAPLKPPRNDRWTVRPTIEEMIARDPSEAADSSNILPALRDLFPTAEVVTLGGALYHFGLNGIYPKLDEGDSWVFDAMLTLDDALLDMGELHFAAAFAKK